MFLFHFASPFASLVVSLVVSPIVASDDESIPLMVVSVAQLIALISFVIFDLLYLIRAMETTLHFADKMP